MRERSVRIRRASAADRSANDTAKQAMMTRETEISAEHVKEEWRAKEKQSSQTADHVVVNCFPVERVHQPRTNSHEVA